MSLRFGLCTCARNPQRSIIDKTTITVKNIWHKPMPMVSGGTPRLPAVTRCTIYSYFCRSYYYLGTHRLQIVLVVAVLVDKQENTIDLSQRQPRVGKMTIFRKFPKVHHGHCERIVSRRLLLPGQELDERICLRKSRRICSSFGRRARNYRFLDSVLRVVAEDLF